MEGSEACISFECPFQMRFCLFELTFKILQQKREKKWEYILMRRPGFHYNVHRLTFSPEWDHSVSGSNISKLLLFMNIVKGACIHLFNTQDLKMKRNVYKDIVHFLVFTEPLSFTSWPLPLLFLVLQNQNKIHKEFQWTISFCLFCLKIYTVS